MIDLKKVKLEFDRLKIDVDDLIKGALHGYVVTDYGQAGAQPYFVAHIDSQGIRYVETSSTARNDYFLDLVNYRVTLNDVDQSESVLATEFSRKLNGVLCKMKAKQVTVFEDINQLDGPGSSDVGQFDAGLPDLKNMIRLTQLSDAELNAIVGGSMVNVTQLSFKDSYSMGKNLTLIARKSMASLKKTKSGMNLREVKCPAKVNKLGFLIGKFVGGIKKIAEPQIHRTVKPTDFSQGGKFGVKPSERLGRILLQDSLNPGPISKAVKKFKQDAVNSIISDSDASDTEKIEFICRLYEDSKTDSSTLTLYKQLKPNYKRIAICHIGARKLNSSYNILVKKLQILLFEMGTIDEDPKKAQDLNSDLMDKIEKLIKKIGQSDSRVVTKFRLSELATKIKDTLAGV